MERRKRSTKPLPAAEERLPPGDEMRLFMEASDTTTSQIGDVDDSISEQMARSVLPREDEQLSLRTERE